MLPGSMPNYSESFLTAVAVVLEHEGGYVFDVHDPGGETNFGISKRSYPELDIKRLTRDDAIAIYHRDFWVPLGCEELPPLVALFHLDAGVNHGKLKAGVWLLQCREGTELERCLRLATFRLSFYTSLKQFDRYGKGWVNRVIHLLTIASV